MILSRDMIPKTYSQVRDIHIMNKIVDLLINIIKVDTDDFTNLLNPRLCPVNMLPMLGAYVGYDYDFKETVEANRVIIEYFPHLIRNRGSETGMALATALSVNSVGDPDDIEMLTLFHIEYVDELDKDGNPSGRIRIYVYYPQYLSKIRDLVEVVRPAGVIVEFIPAIQVSSYEKIIVSDEYRYLSYDYHTSFIIKVDNHNVHTNDNGDILNVYYEIFRDGDNTPTSYYLDTNGNIIDNYRKKTGFTIKNKKIFKNDGEQIGYVDSNNLLRGMNGSSGDGPTTGYRLGTMLMIVDEDIEDENTGQKILVTTDYHVDENGDIIDNSGYVALSIIDRYRISSSGDDSKEIKSGPNRIGFGEVASTEEGLYVNSIYYDYTSGNYVSERNKIKLSRSSDNITYESVDTPIIYTVSYLQKDTQEPIPGISPNPFRGYGYIGERLDINIPEVEGWKALPNQDSIPLSTYGQSIIVYYEKV